MITKDEQQRAYKCAFKRGKSKRNFKDWCVDILSEVTELFKSHLYPSEHIPEFTEHDEELADIVITCMSMAEYYGIDLGRVIEAKMTYNERRED